jgi:CRISPR/Cas system-associated exonuclease Cas4 (RecB family)
MAFKGFICELDRSKVSPEDCLACSYDRLVGAKNHCPFTPPIIRGIIESNQPRELRGYSATELIGCHRRVVLRDEVDYWVKPSQAYWAFRGTLAHAIVEGYHNGQIVEQRFYAELDGMLITGQPDVVYPREKLVVDYKTTKSVPKTRKRYTCPECGALIRENQWHARKGSMLACECGKAYKAGAELKADVLDPQPYDTHVAQLNVYAWLLSENDVLVDTAQVVYLDMSEPKVLQVGLWSLGEIKTCVNAKLAEMMSRNGNGLPAGLWDDPNENWRCRYCAVSGQCEQSRAEETLEENRQVLRGTATEV